MASGLRQISDYTILGEISKGAMGIIYRAEKGGQQFALKMLRVNDAGNILRFRKETAAIARLKHPALVRIVDANEVDGKPFIVMELLEGQSLDVLIKKGRLSEELTIKVGKAIASALGAMHQFGMIHRDVKPANIIVTASEEVKLLDLGLAGDTAEMKTENQLSVVGTISYASPEQCRMLKRPTDARSDLYSLGITLYQCLTASLPFETDSIADLMKMHAAVTAPDVRQKALATSAVLAAVIAKLLEKDPDDRYQSAEGLSYDLAKLGDLEDALRKTGNIILRTRDRLLGGGDLPLAGRKREKGTLGRLWEDALAGMGRGVIIEGEGGSGKSRLTQELVRTITRHDHLILTGKCQVLSSGVPLASLREAMDSLLDHLSGLSDEARAKWTEKLRLAAAHSPASVSKLSVGFKDILGDAPSEVTLEEDLDGSRFLSDLAGFLLNLAEQCPGTILLIDDIQWMDRSTLALFTKLAEHLQRHKLLVLMTARNDEASMPALSRLRTAMGIALEPSIVLGPLTEADVQEVIFGQLGASTLDPEAVRRISDASNGNPFFVTEYVRNLLSAGYLTFASGKWQINQDGISAISLSTDVFQLVLNRINTLGDRTRDILRIAAVIGNNFAMEELIGSSEFSADEVISALQEASQSNLIGINEGGRYRFFHDRIRETLISSLELEQKKKINDGLARNAYAGPGHDKPWFDLARYLMNGNFEKNPKLAYEVTHEAGRLALSNYAFQQAYELLTFAFERAQEAKIRNPDMKVVARDLAMASSESGHEQDAHRAVDLAIRLGTNLDEMVELYGLKLRAYFNYNRLAHAWLTYKQISALLDTPHPRFAFWKWILLNWLLMTFCFKALTGWNFGRIHPRHPSRRRVEALANLHVIVSLATRCLPDRLDLALMVVRTLHLTHSLGNSPQFAKTLCAAAMAVVRLGLYSLAQRLIEWAKQTQTASVEPTTKAYIDSYESFVLIISNRKNGKEIHQKIGPPVIRYLDPYQISLWALFYPLELSLEGDHHEAIQSMENHLPMLERLGCTYFLTVLCWQFMLHLSQVGKVAKANEWRKRCMELVENENKDSAYAVAQYVSGLFELDYEQGNLSNDLDLQIDLVESFINLDHFNTKVLTTIAYIRLAQLEKAQSEEEKKRARAKLKEALRNIYFRAYSPIHRCHWYIAKAGLARLEGHPEKALRLAQKGHRVATRVESLLGVFFASRESARIYRSMGDGFKMKADLAACVTMAAENGWVLRLEAIESEFNISKTTALRERSFSSETISVGRNSSQGTMSGVTLQTSGRTEAGSIYGKSDGITKEARTMAALTRVSLASSASIDAEQQTGAILNEIVKLFGAERAFLFLADEPLESPNSRTLPRPEPRMPALALAPDE